MKVRSFVALFLVVLFLPIAAPPTRIIAAPAIGSILPGAVSAGGYHGCGLRTDTTLACWGYDGAGQATPPTGSFRQVSAGYYHSCGLRNTNTIACWGTNLGAQSTPPTGTFRQLSSGYNHSCGLRTDSTLACWVYNGDNRATPPDGTFIQVSAGDRHSCALRNTRTIVCWGSNYFGQTTAPEGTFVQLSSGFDHNCAIRTNGTLACWGLGSNDRTTPPTGTFVQVSAGGSASCAVRGDGTLACWGENTYGQATAPSGEFQQVSAGLYHSCGLRRNGTLTCWGASGDGRTASPSGLFGLSTVLRLSPSPISFGSLLPHTHSTERVVTLTNTSGTPLLLSTMVVSGTDPGQFIVQHGCPISPASLATGATCTIKVAFIAPGSAGINNAQLLVTDTIGNIAAVALQGTSLGPPVLTLKEDVIAPEGASGTSLAAFQVMLSRPFTETIMVDYVTSDGTATAGVDYTARSGTLTFPAGARLRTINVAVRGDTLDELDETLLLTLSNSTNAIIADDMAVGTIDDDDGPTISVDDALVLEGSTGTTYASFNVVLSSSSVQTTTVMYSTGDDTATAGSDYRGWSHTLTIPPGVQRTRIVVLVTPDAIDEGDESFRLTLAYPINAVLGDAEAIGTILDDDPLPPFEADVLAREGNSSVRYAYFLMALTAAQTEAVIVDVDTIDESAQAGNDYRRIDGKVVFQPGQKQKWLIVQVFGDLVTEPDERFHVRLTAPSGVTLVDNDLIGVIVNDD